MAAGSVAVARSYTAHGDSPARSTRWQGPFEYVREFASSAPGCSYRGREAVHATVTCVGSDLRHLQCTASGTASHVYQEELQQDGRIAARNDAGEYQGALKAEYDTHVTKDVDLFRLDVGTHLPVQYRRTADGGAAKTGEYLLDVSGSTRDLVFVPQNERLERHRVEPIYEPGPAACGVPGRFNGTETIAMRLLPAE
jgi:hypothetical protein